MMNTQSSSIQYVNDISESVENRVPVADQPLPMIHQQSRHSYTTATSTNGETQRQDNVPPRSVQRYTEVRSKRCPEVYKVDKLYVGLLKELPPPSHVQGIWDQEVLPDLERRLCQATSMLSKSMRDEEVITELVLCMAGKKCLPAYVLLKPGAICPKDPIALNPTVWIYCGSQKCKKRVSKAIRNLTYLTHFLGRFGMESPHASLYAPWPAVEEQPRQLPRLTTNFDNASFAIQDRTSSQKTICGARARFTIETSNGIVERYSTIGGLIVVNNSLFAMTSAHAIMNCWLEDSHSTYSNETESTSNVSSDTASDSEISSGSDSDASTDSPYSSPIRMASIKRPSLEAEKTHEAKLSTWIDFQLPKTIAYMSRGSTKGDYSFPDPAPSTSDFALVDLGSVVQLSNEYSNPELNTIVTISDHVPTFELLSGDVWIITSCEDAPVKGYLLEADASVILRGTVMRTKKIQVAFAGGHGLSGSWVVREGKLCGIIYAAYDRSPYLHMLPAERMFQDIAELVKASIVRVANAQDIYDHKIPIKRHKPDDEGINEAPKTLSTIENVLQNFDVHLESEGILPFKNQGKLEEADQLLGKKQLDTLTGISNLASTYRNQGQWKEPEKLEVQAMETRARVLRLEHPHTLTNVSSLGKMLKRQGKYENAEAMYRQGPEGYERILGSERLDSLTSASNLGSVLERQGKYKEAEAMHRRALEGYEDVLGPEHPDTLNSVSNLGLVLERQGSYEEAEAMHRRALKGYERILGLEHLHTFTSVSNLGLVLERQGSYEEAETMHLRAREGREKVLGPEHPDTLTSVSQLGLVLEKQGSYEEAESMHQQALEGREKVLGLEHPDTLTSVSNLGSVLEKQGRYKEAEAMHQQAREGREKILSLEHPDTLTSFSKLGSVLERQGRYKEAEAMHRRALEGYERMLGPEHPYTLTSVSNLGLVLERQGRYKEAEAMHRRALEGYKNVLRLEHPHTHTSVSNLGSVLERQGRYKEAETMHRRALEGREKVLGLEHLDTLTSVSQLGLVLERQGRYREAGAMHRRALEGKEKVLGLEHPDTLTSISQLGLVLERQGSYEEAEAMHLGAREGREKVLGPEHPDTLTSVSNLGSVLERQGRYKEAETMHRRALEGYEKVFGSEHPHTLTSVYHLAFLFHQQNQYSAASKLYQQANIGFSRALGVRHPATKACLSHYNSMVEEMKLQ